MAPVWLDFLQRQQHKQPFGQPGMRQTRLTAQAAGLLLATIVDQVEIQHPGFPAILPDPAAGGFDGMQPRQQIGRRQSSFHLDHTIDEVWLRRRRLRPGLPP